jgi:hypothetical protein
MKRQLAIVASLFLVAALAAAQTAPFERSVAAALDRLSKAYSAESSSSLKILVAVGAFQATGDKAAALQTAAAARDAVLAALSRSLVFSPVERENLDAVLAELELQMSGATAAEGAGSAGRLLNAEAILTGSVTMQGGDFVVSLKLVQVETARVHSESVKVDRAVFVQAAEERLDMQYVSPMGVGLSVSGLGMTSCGNAPTLVPFNEQGTTFLRRNFGAELRYRVNRFMMLGVGIDALYGNVWQAKAVAWDVTNTGYPTPTGTAPFTVVAKGIGIPVALYGVWSPLRSLSLLGRLGAEYCLLDFSGYFSPSNGMGFGINDFGPQMSGEFLVFSAQGGVELFVTPRVAISLMAGYQFGSKDLGMDVQWHLKSGVPKTLAVDVSGFEFLPRVTVYF